MTVDAAIMAVDATMDADANLALINLEKSVDLSTDFLFYDIF